MPHATPQPQPQPQPKDDNATTTGLTRRELLLPAAAAAGLALAGCGALSPATTSATPTAEEDPHLWLEDVAGEKPLAWVRERNAEARAAIATQPRFEPLRQRLRAALDDRSRIPAVQRSGSWLYNLWRDASHARGLWRRCSFESFRTPEPAWQPVLDLDALARAEGENWVWKGATFLGGESSRCLLRLSRGGADATVLREYDLQARAFVPGGFQLPEAKTSATWLDADTLLVGTDTGAGSLTDSGYPRTLRRWRRGTPLAEATLVFEGEARHVGVWPQADRSLGAESFVLLRALDFYKTEAALLWPDGRLQPIDKPDSAQVTAWRGRLVFELREDWMLAGQRHAAGSLLLADARAWLAGSRDVATLFTPTPTRSLEAWHPTASRVLLEVLEHVAGRLEVAEPEAAWPAGAPGRWRRRELPGPALGAQSVQPLRDPSLSADPLAESYLLNYTDFLTPQSLLLGSAETQAPAAALLKQRPAVFDASGMKTEQHFATSKDGTRVPYFVVWPRGARADGRNPTLLYGYGGFQVSQVPWYSTGLGTCWLGQGGLLVVANIRGGGEYGPAWHQAAVKEHKQRSYDDFIAVAEDLVARGITAPKHLGILGGSNGGLLVGAVMLQRPELFGAVLCSVPLLDMRRYHKLLAGASWMAEYGNPDDPSQWAYIGRYSPYQNVRAGMKLPRVLFTTSTRDDRVHPGHARKMVARMRQQGHAPLYYENIEGGHGGAADNAQLADLWALEYSFAWMVLG